MESVELNIINQSVIDGIVAEAERTNEECCGFLIGDVISTQRTVHTIRSVVNSTQRNRSKNYEISSTDYLNAEKFADEHELNLLGVYHSHINCAAIPSEYDRVAAQPNFFYLIISIIDGKTNQIRCWRLEDSKAFIEETFTIV